MFDTVGNLFEKVVTKKLPYKAKELPKQPTDDYASHVLLLVSKIKV